MPNTPSFEDDLREVSIEEVYEMYKEGKITAVRYMDYYWLKTNSRAPYIIIGNTLEPIGCEVCKFFSSGRCPNH